LELDGIKPLDLDEIITPASTPEHSSCIFEPSTEFVQYINEPYAQFDE
jgi:hypothetical protein